MGKSVLITGCSEGGIGYALAEAFQRRGLTVFATARMTSKMSGLTKYPNVTLLTLDVTSTSDIAAAVEAVKSMTGGKLDYIVNNSARHYITPVLDMDLEEAKDLFEVNFWSVLRMIQAFSPLLLASKGTVVNIGSIAAYLHQPWASVYNAAKAAIHIFDETLRLELTPLGVKVLTIVTGSIKTNIQANTPEPKLPPSSHYRSIENKIVARARGNDGVKRMEPSIYAESAIAKILGGATGKVWVGNNATATRFLSPVLPVSVVDHILVNGSGLDAKFTVS